MRKSSHCWSHRFCSMTGEDEGFVAGHLAISMLAPWSAGKLLDR